MRPIIDQDSALAFLTSSDIKADLIKRSEANHLIILLHGWTHDPDSFYELREEILNSIPRADILIPSMPLAWESLTDLDVLAKQVVKIVEDCVTLRQAEQIVYQRITLAGHSCGGILARQVYLSARGVRLGLGSIDVPVEPDCAWACMVDRIVLLAAVNRGWTISSAMSPLLRFVAPVAIGYGYFLEMVTRRTPVILQIRRGSVHLTNLRLKWLALERQANSRQPPPVVQLLGTVDDIVAPEDNVDLATGARFIYLEAAHSGHFDILSTNDPKFGQYRAELICAALKDPMCKLQTRAERRMIRPQSLSNELAANVMSNDHAVGSKGKANMVCFIVHGIRDNGHWTRKIAERILDRAVEKEKACFIYTPSYGFFPLIAFSSPWTRNRKVEWFLDLYVEALSRHPGAEMVFIGHSNGTYLLAKGLLLCQSVSFDRVLFAGSVVRRKYDWPTRRLQAKMVINFVASRDWVVALFPRAFELVSLPFQDLGSAGHDGFAMLPAEANRSYLPGAHAAGIREELWDDIAAFAVSGEQPLREDRTIGGDLALLARRWWFVSLLGALSPLSWTVVIGLVIAGGWFILFDLPASAHGVPAWQVAVLFGLYMAIVKRFLTKF